MPRKATKLLKEEELIKTIIDKALKSIPLSETEIKCLRLSLKHTEELNSNIRLSVTNHVQSNASLTQLEKRIQEAIVAYLKESYLNLLARTFPNLRQTETDEEVSLFIKFHQIKQVEDFNQEQLSLFFGYDLDEWPLSIDSIYKRVCERIKKVDLFDIDTMGGQEFEVHLKNCFLNWGYSARLTPSTNDYGVDILVTVEDSKIAVQAKRYKGSVGISAIQEVLGGKAFYQCSHALVITTGTFTKNAINLAEQVGVTLIDRSQLKSFLFMNKSLKPYL
jgi:restriction system protein